MASRLAKLTNNETQLDYETKTKCDETEAAKDKYLVLPVHISSLGLIPGVRLLVGDREKYCKQT